MINVVIQIKDTILISQNNMTNICVYNSVKWAPPYDISENKNINMCNAYCPVAECQKDSKKEFCSSKAFHVKKN